MCAARSDQGKDRDAVLGLAVEATGDHAYVRAPGTRPASAGEERLGGTVVLRGFLGDDLLQGDGEVVGVNGAALPDLFAGW